MQKIDLIKNFASIEASLFHLSMDSLQVSSFPASILKLAYLFDNSNIKLLTTFSVKIFKFQAFAHAH